MLDNPTSPLDDIDRALIAALMMNPRGSITELSHQAGVARGTLYARLDRLERQGVITGYGPEIDPTKAGFDVLAFCTLEIAQGSHAKTIAALSGIGEVLEIHTVTGAGDVVLRVIARSNDHLHDVLQTVAAIPSVRRSQTQLALTSETCHSVADVVVARGVATSG